MAPENENQPQREGGQKGGGGGSSSQGQQRGGGGGGGGGQQRRRKNLLDKTNVIGAVIWLISAALTTAAINYFVSGGGAVPTRTPAPASVPGATPLPDARTPDAVVDSSGNVIVIKPESLSGAVPFNLPVILFSMLFQVAISVGQRRLPDPWRSRMRNVDWALNSLGWYWFVCIRSNIFPELREVVAAVVQRMTFALAGQLILSLIVIVLLESLASAFFDAKG